MKTIHTLVIVGLLTIPSLAFAMTNQQVNSILEVLRAFNVEERTIADVQAVLFSSFPESKIGYIAPIQQTIQPETPVPPQDKSSCYLSSKISLWSYENKPNKIGIEWFGTDIHGATLYYMSSTTKNISYVIDGKTIPGIFEKKIPLPVAPVNVPNQELPESMNVNFNPDYNYLQLTLANGTSCYTVTTKNPREGLHGF